MSNIFYGFIFIFLDFTINIGPISLGLIPNFVGYILIINGINELRGESKQFAKAKPWATGMAIYTAIEYVLAIFGIISLIKMVDMISGVIGFVADIYIVAMLISGLEEMEKADYADYEVKAFKDIWIVNMLVKGIAMLAGWGEVLAAAAEPVGAITSFFVFVGVPLIIASLVLSIIFLVRFNRTRKIVEFAKPLLEAKKRQQNQMQ